MSKELTSLERLKNIKSTWNCMNPNWSVAQYEDFDIIETSLKVLEIIKNKMVNVGHLLYCIENFSDNRQLYMYNEVFYENRKLTKQEFELLKGWLL